MDIQDKQYAATVINYFWGVGTATPHNINEAALEVAYEALVQAGACSESMNIVPRPASSKANAAYILKQITGIGKRIKQGDTAIYKSCKNAVGVRYKSRILMALVGV